MEQYTDLEKTAHTYCENAERNRPKGVHQNAEKAYVYYVRYGSIAVRLHLAQIYRNV